MKKTYYLVTALFLLAFPALAQFSPQHVGGASHSSSFTLSSSNQRFWLYVDDVLQNKDAVRSICIQDMAAEEYYIQVELDNEDHNCVGQYVNLAHPLVYQVTQRRGFYGLETMRTGLRPELTMSLVTHHEPVPPQMGQPGAGVVPKPMPPHPSPCMDEGDFNEVCNLVSKETFDSSKLTVAKQVAASNPLCANQVAQICKLLSFENNRLEFAKYAYPYCSDKNKYFLLNEVFSYDASKRELDEYIKGL